MNEVEEKEGQLSIELDDKTAEGVYSNLAIINHSATEFVVDFVSVMPGMPKGKSAQSHYPYPRARQTIAICFR